MHTVPVSSERPEAPLFCDGLGERVVAADGASGELLQILRVRPALTAVPSFEFALRERAARLANFRHGYFARVRRIDRVQMPAPGLAIVSEHVEGTRLSDILRSAADYHLQLDINTALCLIRQLVPAVALLHENARDVAHGLLSPERLIVTPHARLVIAEHVLGAAVEQLQLSRERLWQEFRVALPASAGVARFDHRADMTGVGLVALALLLGRPLGDDEYPHHIPALLNAARERSALGDEQPLSPGLRDWLSRALQLDPRRGFASAPEALSVLEDVVADASAYVAAPVALETFLSRYAAALLEPVPAALASPVVAIGGRATRAATPDPMADLDEDLALLMSNAAPAANWPSGAPFALAKRASDPAASLTNPTVTGLSRRSAAVAEPGVPALRTDDANAVLDDLDELDGLKPFELTPRPARPLVQDIHEAVAAAEIRPIEPASAAVVPEAPSLATEAASAFSDEATPEVPAADAVRPAAWKARAAIAATVVMGLGVGGYYAMRSPAAPVAAIQMGTLDVQSSPAGVPVFVDGEERGETPARLTLKAGAHILELRGHGVPRVTPINVTAGGQVSQYIEFANTPVTGQLQVQSQPAGAKVAVDGVERGVAPVTVANLTPGEHEVVLRSDAGSVKQTVSVMAGGTASIVAPITAEASAGPVSGWVSVQAPVSIEIREGGKLLGTSDADRVMMAAGRHELELANQMLGYRVIRVVQVPAGKTAPISVELPNGVVNLNASPWAEVFIDGQRVGETPIGNLNVPIGPHEVVFKNPQLGEKRHAISVSLAAPIRLSVDMK